MGGSPLHDPSVDRRILGEPTSEKINELRDKEHSEGPDDKFAYKCSEEVQNE